MLPYGLGLRLKFLLGRCALCRFEPISEGFLCQACDADVAHLSAHTIACGDRTLVVQSAGFYSGALANAIGAYKDRGDLTALPILAHAVFRLAQALDMSPDTVLLPMPTTADRLIARGFYPVGVLARYMAIFADAPLYDGVRRIGEQSKQRLLNRAERLANVNADVFCIDEPPRTRSFVLFDDVATTGATLGALAQRLWRAYPGARVQAACLAHGAG